MARYVLLAALLISACDETHRQPSSDGGIPAADDAGLSCTHDEDCAALGPYGYCRTWSPGAVGTCVID